jgi:uncharacterized membrane protein YdfJ with MMPL/SSD domain
MVPAAHDAAMTAVLILIAALALVLASVRYGVDSRRTSPRGHYRPNWRS